MTAPAQQPAHVLTQQPGRRAAQPAAPRVEPRVKHWPARYRPQELRKYRGNAFLEALPPILPAEEATALMAVYPEYDPDDRELPSHLRLHQLSTVLGLVQPLTEHNDLQVRISRMIRDGYLRRNPLDPAFEEQGLAVEQAVRASLAKYGTVDEAVVDEAVLRSGDPPAARPGAPGSSPDSGHDAEHGPGDDGEEFRVDRRARAHATGMTLLGISGVGKTTALERILALYPQVIAHREYDGRPLPRLQIVWLKLECPHDGSIRGVCVNFFQEVDAILGTDYLKLLVGPRDTAETLLPKMASVAWQHGIGLLAIDEIQHLSQAKSGGEQKLLNFFVTLVNQIGLPVLLVGTYKASKILAGEFRQARRGCGQGDFVWDPMEAAGENAGDWRMFVETLALYQYTRHDTPLTDDLVGALFEESQGITVLVVLLWMLAQERAIVSGEEVVTPGTVESVAKDRFRLLRPLLLALRAKDETALRALGDVLPDVVRANVQPSRQRRGPRPTPLRRPKLAAITSVLTPVPTPAPAADGTNQDGPESPPAPARARAPRRPKTRGEPSHGAPAGSLPRLVANAGGGAETPHDVLRASGLLCDVVGAVEIGGVPSAAAGDVSARASAGASAGASEGRAA